MAGKRKTGFWLWLPLAAVLVIGTIAAIKIIAANQQKAFTIKIDEELSLRFVGIASEKSPVDLRSWQERMYDDLPEFLKKHVVSRLWRPASRKYWVGTENPETLKILFLPVLTRSPNTNSLSSDRDLVIEKLSKNSHLVRLKYTDLRSYPNPIQLTWTGGSSKNPLHLYGATFTSVPRTQKHFELEVIKEPTMIARQLVASLPLENPLYQRLKPIGPAEPLPATKTHNGISVTLHHVLYNVSAMSDAIVTESSHPGMQAYSVLIFTTSEINNDVKWGIEKLTLSYSDRNIPLTFDPFVRGQHMPSSTGLKQKITYAMNVAAAKQPIKIEAQVAKLDNFSADELQTVEIQIPAVNTAGHSISTEVNGSTVTLLVSVYKNVIPPELCMINLEIQNAGELVDVLHAKLHAEGESGVSIDGKRTNTFHKYEGGLCKIGYNLTTKPSSYNALVYRDVAGSFLSRYTTLTLKLVNPERVNKAFEFIATPSEPHTTSE